MAATEPETRTVVIDGEEVLLVKHTGFTTTLQQQGVTERTWWESPHVVTRELTVAEARSIVYEEFGQTVWTP